MSAARTVLFIVDSSYSVGGLHTRYRNLGHVLPQAGWQPVYALTRGNQFHDPLRLQEMFRGLDTIALDARTGTWDARIVAIERSLQQVKPEVIVTGAGTDAFYVTYQRKQAGRGPRLVCGLPGIHPRYMAMLKRFNAVVDAAYAVNPLGARILAQVVGIQPERVFYVPTGVPVPEPRTPASPAPRELRIGYVGRLTRHKRVMDLVPLCAALTQREVPFSLRIFGEGPLERELRTALREFGDRCHFEGAVSNEAIRDDVMPELDVCLFLTENEGTPNTALEAMAAGAVVVTSDFPGRAELDLLRSGDTALVFPIGAVDVAADLLANLANHPDEQQRLAANALDAVKKKHDLLVMGQEFAKMLSFACDGPPMAGEVALPAIVPPGRLTRLLGPATAEMIRRFLGRRFPHPDASEWPANEGITPAESGKIVDDLQSLFGLNVDEAQ
jgi:glycosyltransferase involved in cell wall biosynthesis